MLLTVCHRWPVGERFALNCYMHWGFILLRQPGDTAVILLSQEGVTQGDPLLMVLYRITLVHMAEELRDEYPTLVSPFYANDVAFNGLTRRSTAQLRLLLEQRPDQGYFPEPDKFLFVSDNSEKEEAARRYFELAGLNLNYVYGSQ